MESINEIFTWLSEHEAGFSALAALVVIIGGTLSPLGVGMRGLLSRRQNASPLEAKPSEGKELAGASTKPAEAGDNNDHSNRSEQSAQPVGQSKDRPVVAVLPLNNMSTDEEQGYLAEGMTEDIITALARYADMDVIARNSTFV